MSKNFYMDNIGRNAKIASNELSSISLKKKNKVLKIFSNYLKSKSNLILRENKKDIYKARKLPVSLIKRLELNKEKISQIRKSIKQIINFKDPVGKTLSSWTRPNGLVIKKISIPIGVIGVIYESRPNVTADVSVLCFKSGNAAILRGGSEAFYSNKILSDLFRKSLKEEGCNENCIQFIRKQHRSNVDYLLARMKSYVDIIIPRGGKSLVKKVQSKSKIPTIGHLEGICHVYIDHKADLDMAIKIVKNSKMRNFSICGAAETLLIDFACVKTHCKPIINELIKLDCEIIADTTIIKHSGKRIKIATQKDWDTEYLAPKISIKCVDGVNEAVKHINKHGTSHTDTIVTNNKKTAEKFLSGVSSSIAILNASTQFSDGGEFGFGAEVGISTQKTNPRGPVGLNQLTVYKYILKGKGQVRK